MMYRKEIDGLRAIAVLAVMLFHAGFSQFSGGYVGVDVFLVISGYLITTILLDDIRRGEFSLKAFYDRRARRILPALLLVLGASSIAAVAVLTPRELVDYSKSLVAVSAFLANVFFWRQSGYFDTDAEHQPLLHMWSLAVEEQYYILFPLLLVFLMRRLRTEQRTALVLGGIALASLALGAWGAHQAPGASFFLLQARAWELLVGALLATRSAPDANAVKPWARQLLAGLGLGAIACAVVTFDATTPFPGVHALVPTVGAALLIVYASPATAVGRLLASRVLVGIGLVSYSAYLWHQPLLAFARVQATTEMSLAVAASLCAAALVLGAASWKFVEQPFRRRGVWRETTVLAAGLAGLGVFVVLGVVGVKSRGLEALYEGRLAGSELRTYDLVKATTARTLHDDMVDDGACRFWSPALGPEVLERYRRCTAQGAKALVVLGDSHAMNIYNALARTQAAPVVVGFAQAGCHPHRPARECHYQDFARFAATHAATIERIVFHQSGSYLVLDAQGAPDKDRAFGRNARYSIDDAGIAGIHRYLNRLARDSQIDITWLGPFLEPRRDMRDHRAVARGVGFTPEVVAAFEALETRIAARAADPSARYRYVPMLGRHIGPGDAMLQGGCLLYRDKDHLSACGETRVGEKLKADPSLAPRQ